jgi:hypothetical protein
MGAEAPWCESTIGGFGYRVAHVNIAGRLAWLGVEQRK